MHIGKLDFCKATVECSAGHRATKQEITTEISFNAAVDICADDTVILYCSEP